MKLRFSDRIGATKPSEIIQTDSMNDSLKNSLWNFLYKLLVYRKKEIVNDFAEFICEAYFKLPLDEVPDYSTSVLSEWIKEKITGLNWFETYNLLELISQKYISKTETIKFNSVINTILENENSGYRFINSELAPITNKEEIKSITDAIESAKEKRMFGTAKHFESALELISLKPNPDYRNSIKESISSIEALVKQLTGEKGGGLDKALAILDAKVKFHDAFKSGLLSLYGYTSDEDGIRHPILEEKDISFDEAKFMLVSCSALVNFLIAKAEKAGLLTKTKAN
jgi:hypothetical protein